MIDCFATDHAPHTLAEKDGANPPPGFPGLETALPLLLTAVHEGRLTLDDADRCAWTPTRGASSACRSSRIPGSKWIRTPSWEIHAAEMFTRCGWTPFEGWQVRGRVRRVVLRGTEAYAGWPGAGANPAPAEMRDE